MQIYRQITKQLYKRIHQLFLLKQSLKVTVFSAAFFLFVFTVFSQTPAWFPQESCREAWSKLIVKNLHHYDYNNDAKKTALGNMGYESYAERVNREFCYKDWTILVYMAADNDLSSYALMDLYEMEAGYRSGERLAGSTLKLDLIVQSDVSGSSHTRRFHMFQTNEAFEDHRNIKFFESMKVTDVQSPIVEIVPSRKGARAEEEFENFLSWGVRKYPAKNYAVFVWGHGQGWTAGDSNNQQLRGRLLDVKDVELPFEHRETNKVDSRHSHKSEHVFGGIGFNSSSQDFLSIPALSRALNKVVRDDLVGKPFALYASDACLMQMIEVATEISDSAAYIIGSTQVQDFMGLPYRNVLREINSGRYAGVGASTDQSAFKFATMIPQVFRASMSATGLQGRHDRKAVEQITMSAISTSELRHQLLPAFLQLSTALNLYIEEEHLRMVDLEFIMGAVPAFEGGAQDLGAFLVLLQNMLSKEMLLQNTTLRTRAQERLSKAIVETRSALLRTVLSHTLGTRYAKNQERLFLLGIRAFSVWLPPTKKDFSSRIQDFRRSKFFHSNKAWDQFLSAIFSYET